MTGNLFSLSRKIFQLDDHGREHWIWRLPPDRFRFVIYLIGRANYELSEDATNEGETISISRGQLLCSYEGLSKNTGLSVRSIRSTLTALEKRTFLTRRSTRRYTILTLCNYDQYQLGENESDTPKGTENAQSPARKRAQNPATSKTLRLKEPKTNTISSKPKGSGETLPLFEDQPTTPPPKAWKPSDDELNKIYQHYPKKAAKKAGMDAAKKIIKSEQDLHQLEAAVIKMGNLWRGYKTTYCPGWGPFVYQEKFRDEDLPTPSHDQRKPTKSGTIARTKASQLPEPTHHQPKDPPCPKSQQSTKPSQPSKPSGPASGPSSSTPESSDG